MKKRDYLNFDVRIMPSTDGYRAQVWDSQGREATANCRSLPSLNGDIFWLRLSDESQFSRSVYDRRDVIAFGRRIFDAVFHGQVLSCLRASQEEARSMKIGLRIRLRLQEVTELASIPWEYLYDPSLERFLALSVKSPVVRYLDLPYPIQELTLTPPLRILVVIARPYDYVELDVDQEWQQLVDALGDLIKQDLVEIIRLEKATLRILQRQLRLNTFHVFHFIGHGGFSKRDQDGVLILEDERGQGCPVRSTELGILLHDHGPLCIAFLNACEGARHSCKDPFSGVAQALMQQGIPAVVAMQATVTDITATTLACEFYRALADGLSLDTSLTEARRALMFQNNVEWGIPVLYLRTVDGQFFQSESPMKLVDPWSRACVALPQARTLSTNEPGLSPVWGGLSKRTDCEFIDDYWKLSEFTVLKKVVDRTEATETNTVIRLVGGTFLFDIMISNLGEDPLILDELECQTKSFQPIRTLNRMAGVLPISGIYQISVHIDNHVTRVVMEPRLHVPGKISVRFLVGLQVDTEGCSNPEFQFLLLVRSGDRIQATIGPFDLHMQHIQESFEDTFRELNRRRRNPNDAEAQVRYDQMYKLKFKTRPDDTEDLDQSILKG